MKSSVNKIKRGEIEDSAFPIYVEAYDDFDSFPLEGFEDTIYVDKEEFLLYLWDNLTEVYYLTGELNAAAIETALGFVPANVEDLHEQDNVSKKITVTNYDIKGLEGTLEERICQFINPITKTETDSEIWIEYKEIEPNLIIGNGTTVITSKSDLASRLGVQETDISLYTVEGTNIEAIINIDYELITRFGNSQSIVGPPITSFIDTEGKCKNIPEYAFAYCNKLSKVVLDNLESIPKKAFSYTIISSFSMNNNIIDLGLQAFSNISSLKNITLSEGLTEIGYRLFSGCGLISIDIPEGVTSIGESAFVNNDLQNVIIPNSVANINAYAFGYNLNLTSIVLPKNCSIGTAAFRNTALTSLTVPSGCTVGAAAFADSQLTNVIFEEGVTLIRINSFINNNLTEVFIPAGCTVEDGAFDAEVIINYN